MYIKKIVLAGLMALLLLSLAATTASALRSIESSELVIRLLSPELTFGSELGINVICRVGTTITLNARSFAKGAKTIGRALFRVLDTGNECRGGRAFVVGGPFPVNYLSFIGTLPRIEGLNLQTVGVAFLVELGALSSCEYIANALGFQEVVGTTGRVGALRGERAGTAFRLEAVSNRRLAGIACASAPRLSGVFNPDKEYFIRLT